MTFFHTLPLGLLCFLVGMWCGAELYRKHIVVKLDALVKTADAQKANIDAALAHTEALETRVKAALADAPAPPTFPPGFHAEFAYYRPRHAGVCAVLPPPTGQQLLCPDGDELCPHPVRWSVTGGDLTQLYCDRCAWTRDLVQFVREEV